MSNLVTRVSELIYQMSNEELNQTIDAIKLKRTHLARQSASNLIVGDLVSFKGRRGHTSGRITKINRKTVVLDCGAQGVWKVTASMLRKVELS
jgi:hypothetical protein